jgi:hypothetical protein
MSCVFFFSCLLSHLSVHDPHSLVQSLKMSRFYKYRAAPADYVRPQCERLQVGSCNIDSRVRNALYHDSLLFNVKCRSVFLFNELYVYLN